MPWHSFTESAPPYWHYWIIERFANIDSNEGNNDEEQDDIWIAAGAQHVGRHRERGAIRHHLRPRMFARQGHAAAVCLPEARRQRTTRSRQAAGDRRRRRKAARKSRSGQDSDAPARLSPGYHRRARGRGRRRRCGGGERSAGAAGGAAEGRRGQVDRGRTCGHAQRGRRAYLQHRRS